jgi:hypothetical protein
LVGGGGPQWGVFDSLSQYPHWFVVACAVVAASAILWLLIKLLKAALWILFFGVLIVAGVTVACLFIR